VSTFHPQRPTPRLEAYVAGLPEGLASHPGCLAKGALVRSAVEDHPELAERAGRLPVEVARLLREPPLAGEWVPEAHFVALHHAVNDLLDLTDTEAVARARARNRALFESTTYRILMAVMSPASLMRFSGKRWENFHRGTVLEMRGASDDGVRVVLSFPPHLFDAGILLAFGQAFAAALELSGAKNPNLLLEDVLPEAAHFRAVWG